MAENLMINSYQNGTVNIADDVIGVITNIAASEIKGIKALSGTFQEDMLEKLGRKNFNKGIDVIMEDNRVCVSISIIVDYGYKIQDVAKEVQENVKIAIMSMTGLEVTAVNIIVEGINTKSEISNMSSSK